MYRERLTDGSLGDFVLTPGGVEEERQKKEKQDEFEALRQEFAELKKGRSKNGVEQSSVEEKTTP